MKVERIFNKTEAENPKMQLSSSTPLASMIYGTSYDPRLPPTKKRNRENDCKNFKTEPRRRQYELPNAELRAVCTHSPNSHIRS